MNNAREGGALPSSLARRRRPAQGAGRPEAAPAGPSASPILQKAGCPWAFRGGGGSGGAAFGWSNALPRPPLLVTSRSRRRLADAGYAEALCGLEIHSSIALAALSAICRHALYPPRLSER